MRNDLKLLLRLHEMFEARLMIVSEDFEYSRPREGYKHEYTETKAILNLLNRLIAKEERKGDN